MTLRSLAILLVFFLAAPLCCCGWHGVVAGEEAAVSCPMCLALAGESEDEPGCPCEKELIQRDLVPRLALPEVPRGAFWVFPSATSWQPVWRAARPHFAGLTKVRSGGHGPPRLFLLHGAWLC
jgi:hypothetical protein